MRVRYVGIGGCIDIMSVQLLLLYLRLWRRRITIHVLIDRCNRSLFARLIRLLRSDLGLRLHLRLDLRCLLV
jgi:hypothetical protein